MNNRKKQVYLCDVLTVITLFFVLAVHIMTVTLASYKAKETGASIESVVKVYEANPLAKAELFTKKSVTILFMLVKPAILLTMYLLFRYFVVNKKQNIMMLQGYTMILFFMMAINFLNDLGVLLGVLAR